MKIISQYKSEILVVALYIIYGLIVNCLDSYFREMSLSNGIIILQFIHAGVLSVLLYLFIRCIKSGKMGLETWGFHFRPGTWVSLTLVILMSIWLHDRLNWFLLKNWFWNIWQIVSLIVEELIFRVLVITILYNLFKTSRYRAVFCIIISSLIFVIPHIPNFGWEELFNGPFTIGLGLGTIYYFTRSALFPIVTHVMLNRTQQFGLTGFTVVIALYFILAILGYFGKRLKFNDSAVITD